MINDMTHCFMISLLFLFFPLVSRLAEKQLKILNDVADGSCALRSLADALSDGSTHESLRAQAAAQFDSDFSSFKHLFKDQSESSKQNMIVELRKIGNWNIDAFDLIFHLIAKIKNMSQFFGVILLVSFAFILSPLFFLLLLCLFSFVV